MKALGQGSVASIIKTGLEVVWWLLLIAALGLMAAAAAYAILLVTIAAGWVSPDILEPGAAKTQMGPITIFTESGERLIWPVVATALLAGGVAVGGSLVIVSRLRRLFGAFTSGEPFSSDNASHLRVLWITMLVMELSRYAIAGGVFALVSLFGQPEQVDFSVKAPVNLTTWGAILVLIVLAEVFREGARLRENENLTI